MFDRLNLISQLGQAHGVGHAAAHDVFGADLNLQGGVLGIDVHDHGGGLRAGVHALDREAGADHQAPGLAPGGRWALQPLD